MYLHSVYNCFCQSDKISSVKIHQYLSKQFDRLGLDPGPGIRGQHSLSQPYGRHAVTAETEMTVAPSVSGLEK